MATPPPPPPPPPELAAAAKRIAALEGDVANLRRGMVQQLTTTGKLVQLALALDAQHFAGRFLGGRQPNPQEELAIAADILAAAAQELGQRGAPAAPVAQPAVTEVLRSELVAREGELAELRRQTAQIQEEDAKTIAELQARLDRAEERVAESDRQLAVVRDNGDDERRSDRAEALGLCSELLRLLQANPCGGDDEQITLQVLQDALRDDPALGTVCQAAESATVAWAGAMIKALADAKAQLAGVEALRTTAGEWQKQAAQLKADLEKSRADARSVAERSGIIEREITKLQTERETLVRDVERLQVELGEQRRAAHEANMARTRDRQETEAIRAKEKGDVESAVAKALAEAAAAQREAEQAIAERDQVVGRMTNAQERIDRLEADRERSAAELAALRREVESTRAEREAAMARLTAGQERLDAAAAEREKALAEREKAATEANGLARELAAARGERDAAQAAIAETRTRLDAIGAERDRIAADRDRAAQEAAGLKRDLDATRAEREAAAAKVAAATERHDAAASDRDRLKGELADLRRELDTVKAASQRASGEREALRERVLAVDGQVEAAARERDQARSQLASAAQERDRFRAALEAAQHEQTALARAKDEMATTLNLRLTETSRQLGELKQVQTRLASENDRLQAELAKATGQVERTRTDAAEAVKKAESQALSRAEVALAEARQQALAADRRATDAARRAEAAAQAAEERDMRINGLAAEIRRLSEQVAAAKAAVESGKAKAYEEKQALVRLIRDAKDAVENAKRDYARQRVDSH